MTPAQKAARRRLIIRRVGTRKASETWARKRRERHGDPEDDAAGSPEADAALDELPDSLVG